MEHPTETKEPVPPRNVLTHPDETLAAMADVEGPEWLAVQGAEDTDRYPDNYAGALAKVRSGRKIHSHLVVGGHGGLSRWLIKADGSVVFLQGIKAGTAAQAAHAARLGFPVQVSGI